MIAKPENLPSGDPVLAALERAAADARRTAYATKTPLVIVKDGKIVKAKVMRDLTLKMPK